MMIEIKKFGKYPGLREAGIKLRLKINAAIYLGSVVILNFDGVESVSSCFVDEFIAKTFVKLGKEEFKKRIKLININNDFIKTIIKSTIRDRINEVKKNGI